MHRIFDAHTHSFPDAVAARAIPVMADKAHIPYFHDGSFASLLDYEKRGGASGFLMLPIATKPGQAPSINAWVRARADSMRGQSMNVIPFGSVHPHDENVEALLDEAVAMDIRGIKLHPEYQTFYADDPHMDAIYRAIYERGLVLCMHAGEDLGFPPPVRADVRRLCHMLDRHPDARIILAHMGGFFRWKDVLDSIAGRGNVWMDTSFAAQYMERELFLSLVYKHGVKRILFGTDAPWSDFRMALAGVTGAGLSEEDAGAILWDNAAELLGF